MKLLIAGAGFIVSDFLPITKDLPKTDIVGITGTPNDLDQMKEYQNKYHIEECFTDYDQALKETAADTAYVAALTFCIMLLLRRLQKLAKMLSVKSHLL